MGSETLENKQARIIWVDGEGHLILPPGVSSRYGIKPNSVINISENSSGIQLLCPGGIAKLYIEPTNQCNLKCRTCLRNTWDEAEGFMTEATFTRIMDGVKRLSYPPKVFFGGLGEPLMHPNIIEMITWAKSLGSNVELITNGTLLGPGMALKLLKSGLDMLWVSLDGATPEGYADVRLGARLPQVIKNVAHFHHLLGVEAMEGFTRVPRYYTGIGIEFVAMKRNIAELPAVLRLAWRLGAQHVIITNALPYTEEMSHEELYSNMHSEDGYPGLGLLRGHENDKDYDELYRAVRNMDISWPRANQGETSFQCQFVARGAGAIGWDGRFSPCLPLLHSHKSFVNEHERLAKRWSRGNINESSLEETWNSPEHLSFRERVQSAAFSPCMSCGGCEMIYENEQDCFGNPFPTCGECLWAYGLIQCP